MMLQLAVSASESLAATLSSNAMITVFSVMFTEYIAQTHHMQDRNKGLLLGASIYFANTFQYWAISNGYIKAFLIFACRWCWI